MDGQQLRSMCTGLLVKKVINIFEYVKISHGN